MLSVKPLTYSVCTKPSSLINNPVIPDQSLIEYGVILHFSILYWLYLSDEWVCICVGHSSLLQYYEYFDAANHYKKARHFL